MPLVWDDEIWSIKGDGEYDKNKYAIVRKLFIQLAKTTQPSNVSIWKVNN